MTQQATDMHRCRSLIKVYADLTGLGLLVHMLAGNWSSESGSFLNTVIRLDSVTPHVLKQQTSSASTCIITLATSALRVAVYSPPDAWHACIFLKQRYCAATCKRKSELESISAARPRLLIGRRLPDSTKLTTETVRMVEGNKPCGKRKLRFWP